MSQGKRQGIEPKKSQRVVLAPDSAERAKYGGDHEVIRYPHAVAIEILTTPQNYKDGVLLDESEARHLARQLRDWGFLDDGAVESICYHCSGPIRCFNHHCNGGGEPNE
jgi:hypothetical protein